MPKLEVVNANNVIEFNPQKANFKLKNTGGPKGEPGAQGPQGPKGDTGAQGPAGASASVTVGSTTTLSPGADATVTNSGDTRNAILNFGIPTGARGPKGDTGSKGDTGPIGPKGAKGDTGAAATVQVGNTNTGAPGTNAQVTNAGNEHFAVFNFTIPRGDKGEKGATGAQGAKGDKGDKGDTGTAATITVGSTTTTNPGTNATVTNTGTSSAAVLNFGIPRGATGSVKSEVVSELPETGEGDTFYLVNREATTQTATGKAISFENSDNAGDITDFQLDGETSQNGTPTPSAPVAVNTTTGENVVKICGKNLWDSALVVGGIGSTNSPLNRTDRYNASSFVEVEPSTTYTFSAESSVSGKTPQIFFLAYREDYSYISQLPANNWYGLPLTIATTAETRYLKISGRYSDDSTIGSVGGSTAAIKNIQLELGSTATDYEPYQGQSYEVNLGKNLFNIQNATGTRGNNTVVASSQTITLNSNTSGTEAAFYLNDVSRISQYLASSYSTARDYKITGLGGSYTLCITLANIPSGVGSLVWDVYTNKRTLQYTRSDIADGKITKTITLSSDEYIKSVQFYTSATSVFSDFTMTVQIEKGSQATSYAAYFTPIELCKIGTYQDYIYKSGGKWYVHKEVDRKNLNGSEDWNLAERSGSNNGVFYIDYNKIGTVGAKNNGAVSNYARFISGFVSKVGQFDTHYSQWRFYAPNNTITLNEWKTNLGATPLVLYYLPATPTDTEITNEALVAQLDNVASAPLYTGVNNITTITPNEQGTLEIKYVTYDKYNQNKVYIWNDTLQQWQIIVP